MSLGAIVNSVANISSRKSDKGKSSDSSLYEFMHVISGAGVQIKSNFEVLFYKMGGFQFFCQSVNIPGLKSENYSLFYHGLEVQVPVRAEQQHEFQMVVINDGAGKTYRKLRELMVLDYGVFGFLDNGFKIKIKQRGDGQNYPGMNIIMEGVRITGISGLDFSHTDSTVQTFTVDAYAKFTDFERGSIKTKDGLLGKVDKISNKMSNILGR